MDVGPAGFAGDVFESLLPFGELPATAKFKGDLEHVGVASEVQVGEHLPRKTIFFFIPQRGESIFDHRAIGVGEGGLEVALANPGVQGVFVLGKKLEERALGEEELGKVPWKGLGGFGEDHL